MQHRLVVQILAALDEDHNATIYDVIVQTLRSQESTHIHHQRSVLDRIPDLLDLLSERASSQLASSVVKAASSTYESELQSLILKQSGLHFSSNKTGLGPSVPSFWRHSQTSPNRHCKFWQSPKEIVKKIRFGMEHVMGQ